MKKFILVKTLRLVPPTICWSNPFHMLITLLKKCFQQSRLHLSFAI